MGLRLTSRNDWQALFSGDNLEHLNNRILPEYLPKQRWFGSKAVAIESAGVLDWAALPSIPAALAFIRVENERAGASFYVVPLALGFDSQARDLQASNPRAVVATVTLASGEGILYDAMWNDQFCGALLDLVSASRSWTTHSGLVIGEPSNVLEALQGIAPLQVRRSSAEQSNTSVIFGDRLILKLFRHPEPGENPDAEIGRFLTETAHFDRIPSFGGTVEYQPAHGQPTTIAMLQGLVVNQGDGWKWMLQELEEAYASCLLGEGAGTKFSAGVTDIEVLRECANTTLDAARVLGRRTAELHLALASSRNPAFTPEPLQEEDVQRLQQNVLAEGERAFSMLQRVLPRLNGTAMELAADLLDVRDESLSVLAKASPLTAAGARTRIHGDYHLGQVLVVNDDFVILDFEGEPARSLSQRRAKQSPLKDVAGMLRSFSYAGYASLMQKDVVQTEKLQPWAELWDQTVSAAFLGVYRHVTDGEDIIPQDQSTFDRLLQWYLLEKVLYELRYELNNRPGWVEIPLRGILSFPQIRTIASAKKLRKAG